MKQRLSFIVVTDVDHDKQNCLSEIYEKALQEAVREAVKKVLGTPKKRTEVLEFEYGDPV